MLFPEGGDVGSVKKDKQRPNWLLRILLFVSLGLHLIVLVKISGLYTSGVLNYIELELKEMTKPWAREIPRPRQRLKSPPKPENPRIMKIARIQPPRQVPQKIEHPEELDNGIGENIPMPDLDSGSASIGQWQPEMYEDGSQVFSTAESYLEMVKLRIEQHKKYPQKAQERQIEGRVPVSFVITLEGNVKDVKVVMPQNVLLDEAALKAIQNSAPFPRPPARVFKGAVPLRVVVVFELT